MLGVKKIIFKGFFGKSTSSMGWIGLKIQKMQKNIKPCFLDFQKYIICRHNQYFNKNNICLGWGWTASASIPPFHWVEKYPLYLLVDAYLFSNISSFYPRYPYIPLLILKLWGFGLFPNWKFGHKDIKMSYWGIPKHIQRKISKQIVLALIPHIMVQSISFLDQIATFGKTLL